MTRGRAMESNYSANPMNPTFRVTRSPLPPERPPLYRHGADYFYDDSDDGEDDFYDSQDMPNYDDPAFSTDPRDNPHLMSRTDLTRMGSSPIPPAHPEHEGGDDERLAYRSRDPSRGASRARSRSPFPPQPPLTTSSDSSSSSNDHSLFPGSSPSSYQTSANSSSNVSPTPSAEKVNRAKTKSQKSGRSSSRCDLDKVDQLDASDPFGFMRHHDGPYQTVNDALTKRAPPASTSSEQRKPKAQPPPQTHIPSSTSYTGGVLNLVPGQLMRKMPYQPEPPVDWVSPPPTVGRLPVVSPFPDQYSYDPADLVPQMAPHPSEYRPPQRHQPPPQPLTFPSLASLSPNPNTVLSITNPDPGTPLPAPRPPAPNPQHHHHPPSARKSRLSLPAQSHPSEFSKQSPLHKPSSDVSHSPSMPISSPPARSPRDKSTVRANTLNMHTRSYDPRQNTYPHESEIEPPEIREPHDSGPALSHDRGSFEPRQDSHLAPPDIRLPRPPAPSVMTASTDSSKRSGKGLPRHVPKKLVMPTPLQPLQNLNQGQGLAQGNVGSTNSAYYPPPHSNTTPLTPSVSMSTSTHTHQQLHLSKSRKSQYGGLTSREMQMARASGYYPSPASQSQKSQHHQSPGIQPSLSIHAPPVPTSDRSERGGRSDREQEREHRRSRRQTIMNPGVGGYLETKATTNGFDSSIGSRSSNSGSGTRSRISGSRSERGRGRSHRRAPSDGYRAGYESSGYGGQYVDMYGYSDPNLPANGQSYPYQQPEVYAPGPQPGQPFAAEPDHRYDQRTNYDPQRVPGHDTPSRDRERDREHRERRERREHRDRDGERGRSHKHTRSYPTSAPSSHPHPHPPQPPSAQDIPMIQDDKHTRHTLKKRATVGGQPMSWTTSVNDAGLASAPPMKERQKSRNRSQSHLGHSGVEGVGPYLDVPGMKDREKSSQSTKSKKSSGFGLGSLFRSSSSKDKEERKAEKEKERMDKVYQEWAASGAGTAISNSSSKSGRKLSKVRSRK